MNDSNNDNEIIEITNESDDINELEISKDIKEAKPEKKKINKRSLIEKWKDIPRKKRTIIIIAIVSVIVLISVLLIYLFLFKDKKAKTPEEEPVIIEKDNYRYENGKLIFQDKSNRDIGSYECTNKDADKCIPLKLDYTEDKFERVISEYESGEEISKNSQVYLNKYVFIQDGENKLLYNINDKNKLLDISLVKWYGADEDYFVIKSDDNKYGLIHFNDESFEYLIRPSYDYLGIVNTKLVYLIAKDKDETYIIDKEGKTKSKNILTNIMSANDKYVVGLNNSSYNLYTLDYEEVVSDYDYIGLHDSVISLVKGTKLYLIDSNLNKLYEDGIRLNSKDYVKKYIYNKDNKLIETKKSYEVSVINNVASITIGNDIKSINMFEGLVSSKMDYISYFDGKLYFYSDIEKADLLGTYSCNSKNSLTSETSTLTNCNLISYDNGYSGIYNNDYIFVFDKLDGSPTTYYLYSIKDKKVKGTYETVIVVNKDEINSMPKQIYTSSSYFIVKAANGNNKGNYGVLEINSSKVFGKVPFNFESIAKINNYYSMTDKNSKKSLYNSEFEKISLDFDYIKMYDKYYVGISNQKLNVYRYDSTNEILETSVSVTNNDFEIDFTNGFLIKIGENSYDYDENGKIRTNADADQIEESDETEEVGEHEE